MYTVSFVALLLPVYFKANKMNFPVKPECLNFTPLKTPMYPINANNIM